MALGFGDFAEFCDSLVLKCQVLYYCQENFDKNFCDHCTDHGNLELYRSRVNSGLIENLFQLTVYRA